MQRKLLWALLAGLLVIALARGSHADTWDHKGQPGAACRPERGERAASFSTRDYIQNDGVVAGAVACPIVRDSSYPPKAPLDVSVTVQSSGDGPLTCTLHSLGATGNLIGAFSRSTRSAIPTTLFFTIPPQYVGFGGSAYILCALPPGGLVLNYYAGEAVVP